MEKYYLLNTDNKVIEFNKYLYNNRIENIAMDFEGEFNLHEYGSRLCLIQIFDGTNFYIIDPFTINPGELKKTMENRKVIKYFYGAESDRSIVYRQYGIKIKSIYDLKMLVDVLDFKEKGLDNILNKVLGIEILKKKKYQRYNWTKRPINDEAIQYALSDVKYLFELHEKLYQLIVSKNLIIKLINKIIRQDIDYDRVRTPKIFKNKEFVRLSDNEKQQFRDIIKIRDSVAQELNIPATNILVKEDVFSIVKVPNSINEIKISSKIDKNKIEEMKRQIQERIKRIETGET